MLQEISKKHSLWLKMAYGICKDTELAKDIVQDMYIKVSDIQKELNDYYIYYILRSIFIDITRKEKKRLKAETNYNYINIEQEQEEQKQVPKNVLTWVEEQILIHRYDKSCRDIEKQFNINFLKVHRIEKTAKQKIKEWQERENQLKD